MHDSAALASRSTIHSYITLGSSAGDILIALGILAVLSVVVVIIGTAVHRKLKHDCPDDDKLPPFGLHQLRQMHEQGQLTQEEYDRAVAAVVAQQSTAVSPPNDTHPNQPSDSKPHTPSD